MPTPKPKTTRVAFFLWFIIGGMGAHRIYVQRYRSGAAIAAYTVLTIGLDFALPEIIPGLAMETLDTISIATTLALYAVLIFDAFNIRKWIAEINERQTLEIFD